MQFFLYLLLSCIISSKGSFVVNLDGTLSTEGSGVSVILKSNYDFPVAVNYLVSAEEESTIMEIEPHGEASMSSTMGHAFVVRNLIDSQIVKKFTVGQKDHLVIDLSDTSATNAVSRGTTKGLHPLVSMMHGSKSTSVGAKFKSLSSRSMDIYFEDGRGGSEQGLLRPGAETTSNTYEGHVFFFTESGNKNNEIARVHITKDQSTYFIKDIPEFRASSEVATLALAEEKFQSEYLKRTGIQWRHYYGPEGPRPPPVLHMWPAAFVGQTHDVVSEEGFWQCYGTKDKCQGKAPLNLRLEVVATHPKVFIIENFFSDFEADAVIEFAKPRVAKSTVGQGDSGGVRKSETRTSSNTWMGRHTSDVANSLYLRAADLLKIDESLLEAGQNAEDIQVVHYAIGEKYDAHHDYGVSGYEESRFLTLLLYLNDMPDSNSGGETSFPKGNDGRGFKVSPKRGTAVLFYSLLEDGNGDDLSLHQAIAVTKGEKWLANFWVWDPKKRHR